MPTLGNIILYISAGISLVIIGALLLKELKNNSLYNLVKPLTIILAGILTFDLFLLVYYFATSDFTYEYVWSYSSLDLPFVYKISGWPTGNLSPLALGDRNISSLAGVQTKYPSI